MSEREFDVVVVGAGPAGEVCAGRLGEAGLDVAIVEHHLIGGECSFYACMPSKALLRPGELLAEVRRIPGVAEAVSGDLDAQAVLRRRDEIVHDLDDSSMEPWLTDRGVTVVRGRGRLDGERRVRAGDETLLARGAVVVATGSDALVPPIDGLREARPWTNREATTSKQVPARLIVLGGGVVGVELAQAWRTLGSQVTLVEAADRLIAREEPFASEQVEQALRERGVDVHIGVKAVAVRADGGEVEVQLESGAPVRGDELLVAIGRRPNTAELGLETIGLEPGAPIDVDEDRGVAVGATFTGPEVAEFLHAATIAVVGEVPLERLFHAVPAFPTRSEVWLYLLEQLGIAGPCYEMALTAGSQAG